MRLSLLLLISVFLSVSVSAQRAYEDPEAYAVYSALIRGYVAREKAEAGNLVLVAETTQYPSFSGGAGRIDSCIKAPKGEETSFAEMISSYKEANKTPVVLQQKFDIPSKYQIVPSSTIKGLFSVKGQDGWKTYQERYPNTPGYMDMSAVGFNKDKTIAVVYFARHCGWLCADGTYYVLRKLENAWTPDKTVGGCTWVS